MHKYLSSAKHAAKYLLRANTVHFRLLLNSHSHNTCWITYRNNLKIPHYRAAIAIETQIWKFTEPVGSTVLMCKILFHGFLKVSSLYLAGKGEANSFLPCGLFWDREEHTARWYNCRGGAVNATSTSWQAQPFLSQWAHRLTACLGKGKIN